MLPSMVHRAGSQADDFLVRVRDLTCGYDGRPVIDAVSLVIPAGRFAAIVGPSGAGKTTLLRALLSQAELLHGSVELRRDHRGQTIRIGYVPQLESIDWSFPVTVEQVVLMGLTAESGWRPWPSREHRERMLAILERLGIAHCARRHIRDLSGGQQQRVFLARALVRAPDLLLLDEPTASSDIKTRHDILHLLSDLNEDGITVLLTTHDLNSVAAHLPWVVCLNGTIVAEGPPDDVFTPDVLSQTYGAEMVVLREGNVILVSDKLAATKADQGALLMGA